MMGLVPVRRIPSSTLSGASLLVVNVAVDAKSAESRTGGCQEVSSAAEAFRTPYGGSGTRHLPLGSCSGRMHSLAPCHPCSPSHVWAKPALPAAGGTESEQLPPSGGARRTKQISPKGRLGAHRRGSGGR